MGRKRITVSFEKLDVELNIIAIKISSVPKKASKQINTLLRNSGNEIKNRIIRRMTSSPPDPSRRYLRGRNKRGRKFHFASFPGFAPRRDFGNLIASIAAVKNGPNEIEVGALSTSPKGKPITYAKFLEEGTKRMAARPWLMPAVEDEIVSIEFDANEIMDKILRDL